MKITFRKINIEDSLMLRTWIKNNEFCRHWYFFNKIPRQKTLETKIKNKLSIPNHKSMIVMYNNFPIGFIQSYPVDNNGSWTTKVKVAENMVSIDYFIGDINFIHKGIGPKMIQEYIDKIIKPDKYSVALISPDPNNIANRKCIEKCGFVFIKNVNVPYKNSKSQESVYIKYI